MDYIKLYQKLIDNALHRVVKPVVVEKHHILPKSMGGTDKKSNIVHFTPREHLLAHILLWKIYRNESMAHALWMMRHTRDGIKLNSKQYEILRIEHSKAISKRNTGRKLSESTKQKLRDANLGKVRPEEECKNISEGQKGRESPRKGVKLSEDTKQKISKSSKGKSRNKGRKVSDAERKKMSERQKGKTPGNKGKKVSEESRKRMSDAQQKRQKEKGSPWVGKTHTDSTKKKMSDAKKGKSSHNSQKVTVGGIEYASIARAQMATGLSRKRIVDCYINNTD